MVEAKPKIDMGQLHEEEDNKIVLKDFDIQENEHFIKTVFIPYFKDLFLDLSEQSGHKNQSITKLVFLDYS